MAIEIFANLSGFLIRNEEKKKKEEKEKLEAEYKKIFGTINPSDWMLKHKQDYIDGKYSGYHYQEPGTYTSPAYHYSAYQNRDYITLYFYEWSNVDNPPHTYYSWNNFRRFCEESSIKTDCDDEKSAKEYSVCYCTCIPGKAELMEAESLYGLKQMLDTYKRTHPNWDKQ